VNNNYSLLDGHEGVLL